MEVDREERGDPLDRVDQLDQAYPYRQEDLGDPLGLVDPLNRLCRGALPVIREHLEVLEDREDLVGLGVPLDHQDLVDREDPLDRLDLVGLEVVVVEVGVVAMVVGVVEVVGVVVNNMRLCIS